MVEHSSEVDLQAIVNGKKFITESMLSFVPSDWDIFIRGNTADDYQRFIFTGLELTKKEQDGLDGFLKYVKDNGLTVHEQFLTYERKLLRYLQVYDFDYATTYKSIQDYTKWSESFSTDTTSSQVFDLLNDGGIYINCRDKAHRCVCIYNVNIIKGYSYERIELMHEAVLQMLQFVSNHCCLPSKAENWILLMDLEGVGLNEIPVTALRTILSKVQNIFRGRAHRAYILNAGWVIRGSWYIFSSMLDAKSA